MRRPALAEQRPEVLSACRGRILEIGFGTGLNVPYYPPDVRRLWILEPNPRSKDIGRGRAVERGIEATVVESCDGRIVADDQSFDTVISTWTLCTVRDPTTMLLEIHRVLRPDGQFRFIEHGRAPDARVARWQDRLNGINRRIGDGCNLNRDIRLLLHGSPLTVERLDTFYLRDTPRIGGYTYRGVAGR
jgi:ubiquinone/menaquinone biosynthesis C-methylase UbiE